jgi:hypothetical protein
MPQVLRVCIHNLPSQFFDYDQHFGPCLDGCHFLHSHAPLPTPLSSFVLLTLGKSWARKTLSSKFFMGVGLGIDQRQPEGSFSYLIAISSFLTCHLHVATKSDHSFLVHLPCVVDVEVESFPNLFSSCPFYAPLPALSLTLASFVSTSYCYQPNEEQDFQPCLVRVEVAIRGT